MNQAELRVFEADMRAMLADLSGAQAEMDVAIASFVEELDRLGSERPSLTTAGRRLLVAYAGQLESRAAQVEFFKRFAALVRDARV